MDEKSKSQTSIGFGVTDETQQTPPGPLPYDQCLYNICVFGIKCQHKKMPLFIIKEKTSLWLPYVYISPGQKWITSNVLIEDIIAREQIPNEEQRLEVPKGSIESMQLVAITRIELPSEELVNQMVFSAKWKCDSKIVCCKDTNSVVWLSIDNIIEHKVPNFWGKDVIDFAEIIVKRDEELRKSFIRTVEIKNSEMYRFLTYNNSSKSENNECKLIFELINETGVKREVMERLHSDFVQHCYPSIYMSFIAFKQYMNRMELKPIDDNIIDRAFKAMKFKREVKDCLTFDEFLLGLIALEPKCPQNRLRDAYIFRFYDSNEDGVLDRSDIKNMVKDIKVLQNSVATDEAIEEEVDKIFNISDISEEENRITFNKFLSKVNSPQLKQISILFRASESLHKLISDKNIYQKIGKTSKVVNKEEAKNCCPKHRLKNFKLAIHKLSVTSEGILTDPKNVGNTDGKDLHLAIESPLIESQRNHSIEVVNKYRSAPNFVIESIRELAKFLRRPEISQQSKKDFRISTSEKLNIQIIEHICKQMEQVFQNENRVLKVQSPAFVLGDIHGNIKDLIQFEDQLWKTAPQCLPSSLVFAGDYVDRGDYSVECVLYLYSLKLLCPNQVFLLRGNHEIRSVQRNFTFEKECIFKYGKKSGLIVFELFNRTFDLLPIAAVIDETIFVVHGGIPFSIKTIDDIMKVPVSLSDPKSQCPAVWEILWSDPMNREDYEELLKFQKRQTKKNTGFLTNTKRSTAYYFSDIALNQFLTDNQLSHVVRAHEVLDDGYKLFLNGRVISLFSSSGYCGLKNKAAAVHIEGHGNEGLIKIVSLQT